MLSVLTAESSERRRPSAVSGGELARGPARRPSWRDARSWRSSWSCCMMRSPCAAIARSATSSLLASSSTLRSSVRGELPAPRTSRGSPWSAGCAWRSDRPARATSSFTCITSSPERCSSSSLSPSSPRLERGSRAPRSAAASAEADEPGMSPNSSAATAMKRPGDHPPAYLVPICERRRYGAEGKGAGTLLALQDCAKCMAVWWKRQLFSDSKIRALESVVDDCVYLCAQEGYISNLES